MKSIGSMVSQLTAVLCTEYADAMLEAREK